MSWDWHQVSSRRTWADSDNWGDLQGGKDPQRPLTLRHHCRRDMVAASGQIPMAADSVLRAGHAHLEGVIAGAERWAAVGTFQWDLGEGSFSRRSFHRRCHSTLRQAGWCGAELDPSTTPQKPC